MKELFDSLSKRIDHFLKDPQLDQLELMRKRVVFSWTLGSAFSVLVLTVLAYILDADIIVLFGVVLLVFYVLEIPLFRKHNFDFYLAIFLAVIILTAFVFMLIFGGITNSAGLIFVGLTCVISSVLMKSVKSVFFLFFLYVLTIIGLAVLNPFLSHHVDITPKINFIFFIINTIWMSAAMMFFIVEYLRQRNKFQIAETNRLSELNEVKSRLFTSITHEFRTPLTLISGFADQIPEGTIETNDAVLGIKKQSKRLLNLVNQILDLAKIDSQIIKPHFIQGNIIEFLKYLFESFHWAAESKGILFSSEIAQKELEMDFDPEKLEAIVVNLVTNAIKFTTAGGSVTVDVRNHNDKYLEISVQDSGMGIPKGEYKNIFDRFYQISTDAYQEGYGIGLTIVKEFTQMMNGQITVKSEPGKGSIFKVMLPITRNAPKHQLNLETSIDSHSNLGDSGKKIISKELPILLIIDDHKDIIQYLTILLKDQFQIITANNGKEGLDLAFELIPDIIISDLMMPVMDGFDFLKKIKSEFRTSHIPVLILTAKADRPSKLEGLKLGAEGYLLKPFDKEELFIRLRKLLDLRKTLHERYKKIDIISFEDAISKNIEDQFMRKVQQVIEAHMDDESFNIKELCQELAMSHTQLYRKFAAITDVTVNKYIRKYRLNKAMDLLKTTTLNISQIALEVGFPNLAYFSRIFTEEFGINPSKVRKCAIS